MTKRREEKEDSVILENGKVVVKSLSFIFGTLCGMVLLCTSCGGTKPAGLTAEARRRFDNLYLEAVNKRLAERHDEAFELYRHCLDIKPDASEVLFDLGIYYLALSDDSTSERYLRRSTEIAPDNIDYKEVLASYYMRKRENKKALPVLEDMVRCNPSRSDVLAQLVNMYKDNGDYRSAIRAIDRIELLEGRNVSLCLQKFGLYRELKEDDKAFAELEKLVEDNPNDLAYKVLVGDQYLLVGQAEKAYGIYKEVQEKEPSNQALRMSLLEYYKETKQDSLYNVQLEDLLYGRSVDDRARVVLMRNYIVECETEKRDSTVVLSAFDRILSSVPETVDMLTLYASYLQLKQMNEQKDEVWERVLKLEPDNRMALLQLLESAINKQDYGRIAELSNKCVKHYPDELLCYYYMGVSYYQLDRSEDALEAFRTGVRQVKPDSDIKIVSDMFSMMGDLYYTEGQKDSAFAAYDSSLVYRSDNIACMNNYAYYLSLEKRELDKAEEMGHRTIVAEPANKTYLDTYAWILFIKGKYAESKLYMEQVLEGDIKDDPSVSAGVLEHAGDIYAMCGDMDKALKYWKMAQGKGGEVSAVLAQKIQQKKYIEE